MYRKKNLCLLGKKMLHHVKSVSPIKVRQKCRENNPHSAVEGFLLTWNICSYHATSFVLRNVMKLKCPSKNIHSCLPSFHYLHHCILMTYTHSHREIPSLSCFKPSANMSVKINDMLDPSEFLFFIQVRQIHCYFQLAQASAGLTRRFLLGSFVSAIKMVLVWATLSKSGIPLIGSVQYILWHACGRHNGLSFKNRNNIFFFTYFAMGQPGFQASITVYSVLIENIFPGMTTHKITSTLCFKKMSYLYLCNTLSGPNSASLHYTE